MLGLVIAESLAQERLGKDIGFVIWCRLSETTTFSILVHDLPCQNLLLLSIWLHDPESYWLYTHSIHVYYIYLRTLPYKSTSHLGKYTVRPMVWDIKTMVQMWYFSPCFRQTKNMALQGVKLMEHSWSPRGVWGDQGLHPSIVSGSPIFNSLKLSITFSLKNPAVRRQFQSSFPAKNASFYCFLIKRATQTFPAWALPCFIRDFLKCMFHAFSIS